MQRILFRSGPLSRPSRERRIGHYAVDFRSRGRATWLGSCSGAGTRIERKGLGLCSHRPAKEGVGLTREMQRRVGLCSGARTRVYAVSPTSGWDWNDSVVAVEIWVILSGLAIYLIVFWVISNGNRRLRTVGAIWNHCVHFSVFLNNSIDPSVHQIHFIGTWSFL